MWFVFLLGGSWPCAAAEGRSCDSVHAHVTCEASDAYYPALYRKRLPAVMLVHLELSLWWAFLLLAFSGTHPPESAAEHSWVPTEGFPERKRELS